ncbi:MAG: hypothetical protein JSS49_11720 [Planctomycetes bacterium]|nr:hypothetical protein [Planctomycetota bacterium]
MSIRMILNLGLIAACMVCHASGEDRVSIRIYSTDSPVTRETNERIEAALRGATDFAFEHRPLKKVLDDLAEKHQINLWIDEETLRDEGVNLDHAVTLTASNIGLETALRLILGPINLTMFVDDGFLKVTSTARAEEIMHTRIYPVADLVGTDYAPLIKLIEGSTSGRWMRIDQEGGVIQPYKNTRLLLIRQTDRCHREIGGALTALREARKLQQINFTTDRPSSTSTDVRKSNHKVGAIGNRLAAP